MSDAILVTFEFVWHLNTFEHVWRLTFSLMVSRRKFDKTNTAGKFSAQVFVIRDVLNARRPESYLLDTLGGFPVFGSV